MSNYVMNKVTILACIGVILCILACSVGGISVACMMAYEEGGAPAVFGSPECPQWVHSPEISHNLTRNCQYATLQGRRDYQEDRVTCNLEMKLPVTGVDGHEEVTVGIAAIFDGHGGDKASELASKKLIDYFLMHVTFDAYRSFPTNTMKSFKGLPVIHHESLHSVLEGALLKAIKDIEREFTKEAIENGYVAGSTGTVALIVNGQYFVAHVGDTKAVMCPHIIHTESNTEGDIGAEELTNDHHPDRKDEKARIEAAGGFVRTYGVPRVNGILAVSRAIGDLSLKRYGVIAEPETTGWRNITSESGYLVIASDGIFETMSPKNMCDIIRRPTTHSSNCEKWKYSSPSDCIVQVAYRTGSTDNLSAIVIDVQKTTPTCSI